MMSVEIAVTVMSQNEPNESIPLQLRQLSAEFGQLSKQKLNATKKKHRLQLTKVVIL